MNKTQAAAIKAQENRSALALGNAIHRMEHSDVVRVRLAGQFIRNAAGNYEFGKFQACAADLRIAAEYMNTYAEELRDEQTL